MKHVKEHAKRVHHGRHAHLGVHSTSAHPGYAHGGHPHGGRHEHSDAAEDRAMIKHMVKPEALKRARGGAAHRKSSGKTHVNIMIGHPGGGAPAPAPAPAAIPAPMGGMPPVPPPAMARPPMPPAPPAGIGGVAGPMRKRGGHVSRGHK